MKLTPQEFEVLRLVVKAGHEVTEIRQDAIEFRVSYNYLGGNAFGSQAICYDLHAKYIENLTKRRL